MFSKSLRHFLCLSHLKYFKHSRVPFVSALSSENNHLSLNEPANKAKLVTNLVKRLDLSQEEAENRVNHLHNLVKVRFHPTIVI